VVSAHPSGSHLRAGLHGFHSTSSVTSESDAPTPDPDLLRRCVAPASGLLQVPAPLRSIGAALLAALVNFEYRVILYVLISYLFDNLRMDRSTLSTNLIGSLV
jgi:hypothetical protein